MTTKTIARWIVLGALFLIPFLSLYVSSSLYFPFITGKNFLFRILVEVAFAGWILLAISDRKYRPQFSWTFATFKTFVVWMLVATLLAVNAHKAFWSNYERMDGWIMLVHLYLLFVVATSVLTTHKLWRRWWLTFVAGSAAVTVYGLLQTAGLARIHQSTTRVDASLGNSEYLAGYFLFAIAITLWQAFETKGKDYVWLRYSLFVLAALQFIVLFATGTRGTLIGLIAAAAFGALLWLKEAGKSGRRVAASVLALVVLIIGGLYMARDSAFVQGSPNLDRLASVFNLKQELGPRLTIWGMAAEGIQEKPLTGWGLEGFNYIFNKYYDPSMYAQEPWFDRAHNLYLDWTVAGGFPALLLFLAVLLSASVALYRAPVSRYERVFLLSALAGYSVQGLVVFDNLFTYIPFVMILGMAHSASSRPVALFENAGEVKDARLDTIVAPAALAFGLVLVWTVNVPSMRAGSALIGGLTPNNPPQVRLENFKKAVELDGFAHQEITEQLVAFASQAAGDAAIAQNVRQEIVNYADEQMRIELTRAPQDARLRLQYAVFLRSIGAFEQSQEQSAIARELSPKKQSILLEQGLNAFQSGQYAAAETFFAQAYELDTRYQEPAAYIAATRIMNKNVPGAKTVLQEVYGTTTISHPIVRFAYYQTQDWNNLVDTARAEYAEKQDAASGYQVAAALYQAGRIEQAVAQIRAMIIAHPESADQGRMMLRQLGINE
jgi:O-antigen ligase